MKGPYCCYRQLLYCNWGSLEQNWNQMQRYSITERLVSTTSMTIYHDGKGLSP